ncbi:MAG: bifunctional DNA-formamidopyrimidine glycosylase/DNA-(apurinic or apyrimidinic site) lyase [Verrucomicrobiae bacterium]|nr:bifunctional DNA-formamidopyrimidine glycosylase/DNA-(apurinic or apyrimidinic site) lyase [Verrucomicrobiae bacterium]
MPELPEVEVLVRRLRAAVVGRRIQEVDVRSPRVIRPLTPRRLREQLLGGDIRDLTRRGKYLVFEVFGNPEPRATALLVHLGMSGRLSLNPVASDIPQYTVASLGLGPQRLDVQDPRKFGRMHCDRSVLDRLGPEPLSPEFTPATLSERMGPSRRPVKVCLMDPEVVAGVGNIYASEALFRSRIWPGRPACELGRAQIRRLWVAIRWVLRAAIRRGARKMLEDPGDMESAFYFGRGRGGVRSGKATGFRVYDREGQPCSACRTRIVRLMQAGRGTFFCPRCQSAR